jgi:RNA polymerase sigma-70 factor (ECF subfamily)
MAKNKQKLPPAGPAQLDSSHPSGARFETTRWTLICSAQGVEDTVRASALEDLCRLYWYPLYAYVRRRGNAAEKAKDLTQEFFYRLLSKDYLKAADREKGKFRTFLLVAMKRFLANEWRHDIAQKRNPGQPLVPIDQDWAEDTYFHEPADDVTPETLYERRWALLLLERAMDEVRQQMAASGKENLYEALNHTLGGAGPSKPYAEIARDFDMNENAVTQAAHRMRRSYREKLRAAIAETVARPEDVEEEIQHLLSIFSP